MDIISEKEIEEIENYYYNNKEYPNVIKNYIQKIIRNFKIIDEIIYYKENGNYYTILNINLDSEDNKQVNYSVDVGFNNIYNLLIFLYNKDLNIDCDISKLYNMFFHYASFIKNIDTENNAYWYTNFSDEDNEDEQLDLIYEISNYKDYFEILELEIKKRFYKDEREDYDYFRFIDESKELNSFKEYVKNQQNDLRKKLFEKTEN